MFHLTLLKQLIAFDGEIYQARRSAGHRILLLTSEAVAACLIERAIAIAERDIDFLGNACEPTLISQIGYEIIFNNGSLIHYAGNSPLHNLRKHHVAFWEPPIPRHLRTNPSVPITLPENVLASDGRLIQVDEEILSFYKKSA